VPYGDESASTFVADKFGNLYGTSSQDGAFGFGSAFVLSPEPSWRIAGTSANHALMS